MASSLLATAMLSFMHTGDGGGGWCDDDASDLNIRCRIYHISQISVSTQHVKLSL